MRQGQMVGCLCVCGICGILRCRRGRGSCAAKSRSVSKLLTRLKGTWESSYLVKGQHLPGHLPTVIQNDTHAVVDQVLHLALLVRHTDRVVRTAVRLSSIFSVCAKMECVKEAATSSTLPDRWLLGSSWVQETRSRLEMTVCVICVVLEKRCKAVTSKLGILPILRYVESGLVKSPGLGKHTPNSAEVPLHLRRLQLSIVDLRTSTAHT
jgi:hypothetical protein